MLWQIISSAARTRLAIERIPRRHATTIFAVELRGKPAGALDEAPAAAQARSRCERVVHAPIRRRLAGFKNYPSPVRRERGQEDQKERFDMYCKIHIRQHERGLKFRRGDFVRPLIPGTYVIPIWNWTRDSIQIFDTLKTKFEHPLIDRPAA
jgi:hypothetical protein